MSKIFDREKPPTPKQVASAPDEEVGRLNKRRNPQRRYGNTGQSGTVLSGDNILG